MLTLLDFGISMEEAIKVFDNLGRAMATWEVEKPRQKDNTNITNCRNCGAPVKRYKCEYCGTVY